jgi:hypothetical protein
MRRFINKYCSSLLWSIDTVVEMLYGNELKWIVHQLLAVVDPYHAIWKLTNTLQLSLSNL